MSAASPARSESNAVSDEVLKPIDSGVADVLVKQQLQFKNFVARRVGDPSLAEDIVQDALIKAIQNGGDLRNSESIVAWFYRILRNAITDFYRSRGAEERKGAGYLDEIVANQLDRVQPTEHAEDEVCGCFEGLLDTLRPAYAELLRRIDLKSEAIADVARDLGITPGNLNVRLHRARQALKTSLERSCGACAEHGCIDCQCG